MNLRSSLNAAYLLLAGVVVIGILMVFIVFKPLYEDIQAKHSAYQASQLAYQQSSAFLDTIERKKAALEADLAQERALAVTLPAADAVEDMTRLLQRFSQETGVTLKRIINTSVEVQRDQAAQAAAGGTAVLPTGVVPETLTLEVSGSYAQMRVFLDDLGKAPRLTDVVGVSLSRLGGTTDQLDGRLVIQFYRYKAT